MINDSKGKKLNKLKMPYMLFCAVSALLLCVCTDVPEHCGDRFPALNPSAQFCDQDNRPQNKCGGLAYNTSTHECDGGSVRLKGSGNGTTYEVTVASAGTEYYGGGSYAAGETVTISAGTAPAGQQFKNWTSSGNGVSFADANDATTTFTMPASAVEVTAVFETTSGGGGTFNYPIEMIFVAGGAFTMGCTSDQGNDCYDDEKPAHDVTLSSFYIGKYEVTQGLWKAVMGSNNNPSYFTESDNLPVENVSWYEVNKFIDSLNRKTGRTYRLPTEAEWEYAARGGKSGGFKYSGSDNIGDVAWYWGNNGSSGSADYGTKPVGTKLPNELGIYDMSGNVLEWVGDWYAIYTEGLQTNPTGPTSGSYRVFRGGSWNYGGRKCRVSDRDYDYRGGPGGSNSDIGFRLALLSP